MTYMEPSREIPVLAEVDVLVLGAGPAGMGAAVWAAYGILSRFLSGSFLMSAAATAAAILVGVAVYAVLIVALRVLTREDLEMMPGGKKLAKILHIR